MSIDQLQQPPAVSARTWDQNVTAAGEDYDGHPADVALAVAPQGIQHSRNIPTIAAAANSYAIAAGDTKRLIGKVPQRRRITIVSTAAGFLNVDQGMAQAAIGLPVVANTQIILQSSGEIWFNATANAVIGYWAEIDLG
jgi:hypothetical protein